MQRTTYQRVGLRIARAQPLNWYSSAAVIPEDTISQTSDAQKVPKPQPRVQETYDGLVIPSRPAAGNFVGANLGNGSTSFKADVSYLLRGAAAQPGPLTFTQRLAVMTAAPPSTSHVAPVSNHSIIFARTTPTQNQLPKGPAILDQFKGNQWRGDDRTSSRRRDPFLNPRYRTTERTTSPRRPSQPHTSKQSNAASIPGDMGMNIARPSFDDLVSSASETSRRPPSQKQNRSARTPAEMTPRPSTNRSSRDATKPRRTSIKPVPLETEPQRSADEREIEGLVETWDPDLEPPRPPNPPSARDPDIAIHVSRQSLKPITPIAEASLRDVALSGDYHPYITQSGEVFATDCAKLGPVEHSQLVLSHHRDMSLSQRVVVKDIVAATI